MKIAICGSIAFYQEMQQLGKELTALGHQVKMPPAFVKGKDGNRLAVADYYKLRKTAGVKPAWISQRKAKAIRDHFAKIEWSDAVLVLNYTKNNIANYIGGNTLLEMGLAFHLKKKIYLLNNIPKISYEEEIRGMQPLVIGGKLDQIK